MGGVPLQSERLTAGRTLDGLPLGVLLTERALTISISDAEVLSWDLGGRLYSVWAGGRTWRRGLSGRAWEKGADADGRRYRRSIEGAALDDVVERAATRARAAETVLAARDTAIARALGRAAAFDAEAARKDAAAFARLYHDVGMLPPDRYLSLVAELTEGCSFHTCTFCHLYRQPFRVRPAEEFARHLSHVRAFMGGSIALRGRAVFLGAANALALPAARLVESLDLVADAFGARRLEVSGFIDPRTAGRRTVRDFTTLGAHGLRRVYLGLESGHDPLLAFVEKPGTASDAVRGVTQAKAAGLHAAIVVILGLGGDRFDAAHVADTAAALNAMPLGAGDIVYFSPLVEPVDRPYATIAEGAGIRPLTIDEQRAQRRRIRERLAFAGAPPQIATYDVGEFVY